MLMMRVLQFPNVHFASKLIFRCKQVIKILTFGQRGKRESEARKKEGNEKKRYLNK